MTREDALPLRKVTDVPSQAKTVVAVVREPRMRERRDTCRRGLPAVSQTDFAVGGTVELVAVEAGVGIDFEFGHELGVEGGALGLVVRVPGEVDHLVGVSFQVVEFFSGALAEAEVPVEFVIRVEAVEDHPGLGGTGVDVGVGGVGAVGEGVEAGVLGFGELMQVAHRTAVRLEVHDVEVITGADGPHGVGELGFACGLDVDFASDEGPAAEFGVVGLGEGGEEVLSVHTLFRRETGGGEEGGGDVDEGDGFVDDLGWLDLSGPAGGEENAGAEVVAVCFAAGEAGGAVVPGDDDEGVVRFPGFFQLLEEDFAAAVEGHALAHVVGEVFADGVHVGEEGRHLASQRIGIESPEGFTRTLRPFAMGVGGVEGVEEGLAVLAIFEEGLEVATALFVEGFLGGFVVFRFGNGLGETIHLPTGGAVLFAEGGVLDVVLVGEADVVTGGLEEFGVAFDVVPRVGNVAVPPVMKLGAGAIAEKVPTGNEGGTAGAAGGRGDEDVVADRSLFCDAIEGGGGDDVVEGGIVRVSVGGGVAAEVIGEEEEDVGAAFGRRDRSPEPGTQTEKEDEEMVHGASLCRLRPTRR